MDPDMHDEPMYVQLLAYASLIVLVVTILWGMYTIVRGTVDAGEDFLVYEQQKEMRR